jgi:signal transduction histidine kinase
MNRHTGKRLHFKTNVQLKSIIGKDLINNDNIAVLELVKNSYDAGSPEVSVEFKNLKKNDDTQHPDAYSDKSSKVLISDSGIGMDEEDISDKWLNIAYSEKKQKKERDGRTMAGAKGVGRFSCDRLGRFLDMYTRKRGKPLYRVSIDWKDFEIDNEIELKIQDIPVSVEEIDLALFKKKYGYELEQGTVIEISKLRSQWTTLDEKKDKWDTKKILDLKRYLEKLLNPNQAFESKGFGIRLIAKEFKKEDKSAEASGKKVEIINGIVTNKIFEKLEFTTTVIESRISPNGDTITTTLTDKNREVFTVVEKNADYNLLTDVAISIFYLNPYSKAYFKKHTGIRSVNFGSIFLFINGFRVNPLGDQNDDWLGMEIRKGQGYSKFLGTREVVGRIEINDFKENFKVISSREGIVKDRRLSQIVDVTPSSYRGFFYKTLKRLERYVVKGLDWDRTVIDARKIEPLVANSLNGELPEERYMLSQYQKNENVMGLLSSIILIETRQENIITLHINEELLVQLLSEQEDKAREKFNKFFAKNPLFSKDTLDDLTWNTINSVRNELEEKRLELVRKKRELAKRNKELAEKERKLRELRKKKKELAQALDEKDNRIEQLEVKSKAQEKQIYFQQRHMDLSGNYTELLNLHHQIGISSETINGVLAELKESAGEDAINKNSILECIEVLSYESHKINSLALMATGAKFSTESTKLYNANLTQYIVQYINEVSKHWVKTFDMSRMSITLDTSQVIDDYICDFKPVEIAMLFDNLFSNSKKANARNITVSLYSVENELEINILDDGEGVPWENREKIFEFGFSTTYGTGLGLSHVKKILKGLNGTIRLHDTGESGCEFLIRLEVEN